MAGFQTFLRGLYHPKHYEHNYGENSVEYSHAFTQCNFLHFLRRKRSPPPSHGYLNVQPRSSHLAVQSLPVTFHLSM